MPCGCTLPLTPARRRLGGNDLGVTAKQTLRALEAARSGLKLHGLEFNKLVHGEESGIPFGAA